MSIAWIMNKKQKLKDGILKMGKGQRARDLRSQEEMIKPKKTSSKKKITAKKSKGWVAPLVTALVIILIVGIFVLTYLDDNGIILRGRTVMETENFEVSGTMMKYATMSTYQNFLNSYSDIIQYLGLDTSRSLASQKYGEGTWLDYFRDSAKASLEMTLIYAEAAKAAGVELDEDDIKAIDDTINSISLVAAQNGYTEKAYLAMLFGKGVNKDDIREFHMLTTLGNKYEDQIAEKVENEVTDEEVNTYYSEHLDDYSFADFLTYSDTLKIDASLSDEEKTALKEEFSAKFDAMLLAQTKTEFLNALTAYLTDAGVTDIDAKLESAEKTLGKTSVSSSEAAEWMFEIVENAYQRTDGEAKRFTSEKAATVAETTTKDTAADTSATTDEDGIDASELLEGTTEAAQDEFTVSVYFLVRAPYANEAETKNVGHILVSAGSYSTDADAKAAAEALLEEYKKGEMTKESFEKIAEENTADSSVFYDNVKSGQMVPEFDEWIFDESRVVGDTGIVKSEDYGYHVMYFVGEGLPVWEAGCRTAIVGEKTGYIYTELQEKHTVTVNDSAMKAVRG